MEYTKDLPSPELYRKWGGIAAIAGALERKVWIYIPRVMKDLYPGMYTVLAGPPAVGKTIVTSIVQELWTKLTDHHIAPTSVSRASLMDALYKAERSIVMPQNNPPVVRFNSLLIIANELGGFIPVYDSEFMNTLTDIWNGYRYAEKKRGKDLDYAMSHPQLNILAGTTPSYLNELMPTGAWDQGFISRTMLVYSAEPVAKGLFDGLHRDQDQFNALLNDLRIIGALYGKMVFTADAALAIAKWDALKGPPTPDHPKLIHYLGRRTEHLLKLCMVSSVSKRDNLIIDIEDYNEALSWLLEAEAAMPDIFKTMAVGGDARAVEDTYYYAYQIYAKTKEPVSEEKIMEYLSNRVPAHSCERILQVMVKAGLLSKGIDGYKPRVRAPGL